MKRRNYALRSLIWLFVAALSVLVARPAVATTPDAVGGTWFFFDRHLEKQRPDSEDDGGIGQAEIIEGQEHAKLFQWSNGGGHCLRFSPEKVGDSVSFRIHVAQVITTPPFDVKTAIPTFQNEGIYQFLVNDKPVGEPHDCFFQGFWEHGTFSIVPGDYKITYRYVGKNPKSKGNVLDLRWISLG